MDSNYTNVEDKMILNDVLTKSKENPSQELLSKREKKNWQMKLNREQRNLDIVKNFKKIAAANNELLEQSISELHQLLEERANNLLGKKISLKKKKIREIKSFLTVCKHNIDRHTPKDQKDAEGHTPKDQKDVDDFSSETTNE